MGSLANKTFFKFLFGFITLLIVSFFITFGVQLYEDTGRVVENCDVSVEC